MLKIKLPLRIQINKSGKNKYFRLNLNEYRNTHFRNLWKAKKAYTDLICTLMRNEHKTPPEPLQRVSVEYKIYSSNKKKFDLMNFVSIFDKFFLDALVEANFIEDDCYFNIFYKVPKWAGLDTTADYHYCIAEVKKI